MKPPEPSGRADARVTAEQLARQARAGCRSSFAELVQRFAGPLQDFLRQRCGDRAELEDLVQESFLAAWEGLERYDDRRSFSTWLFTLAWRRAVSRWRKRRWTLVAEDELERESHGDDPAELADRREESANLWDLADQVLPPSQRAALWLAYAEGADTAEIARILGKARPTVRVLLFRARRTLQKHLLAESEARGPRAVYEDPPSALILRGES